MMCVSGLSAQDTAPAPTVREHPVVSPTRTDTPPKVDGLLDDAVWSTAARVTNFVQERPVESAPASEQTEILLAYDSQQLYFGVRAHYTDRSLMRANRADRDQAMRDDTVQFYFDPFLDQQRGYLFSVNAYGVQGDGLLSGSGGNGGGGGGGGGNNRSRGPNGADLSWDALYHSAGALTEDGWTAEVVIPFKSLRYPAHKDGAPHKWGLQIAREIQSRNEMVVWAPVGSGSV